jgi:hypothetical protein
VKTLVLIVLALVALVALFVALSVLGFAVALAWTAPLLFLYIILCFFWPPALLAIPILAYFGFKRAELDMQQAQLQFQLEQARETERLRDEMEERLQELEAQQQYDD